ncbi:MAG: ShlB/FhaC/HecB family hemolysin secretion/activation protein [Actinomycetes bacterium]
MNLIKIFGLVVLGAVLLSFANDNISHAQTPNPGTILRQEQELEKRKNLPTQIPKSLLEKKTTQQTQVQGEKILVKNFKFEGEIKQVSLDILNGLVKEYVGKNLTFDEIQNAVKTINDYYKSKGYFLANVILPKQEVKDGIIIININEGKLDPITPYKLNKKDLRIPEERIKAYLDDALNGNLKQESLERGLLNINDNPGVASSANIEPGSAPGTSTLLIEVIEGPLVDGSVTVDNYGSRYTGDIRGTLSVDLNNPSGYGDILNGTIVKAYDADFESKKISYEIPVGVSGLRIGASYTELTYGLGKELTTNPKSTGTAESYNVNLKYPIYRSAAEALLFNSNYDKKLLYNTSTGTVTADKELQNYNAGLTYQLTDQIFGGGFSQADVVVTRGNFDLSASSTSLTDDQASTGAKTNGDFTKTKWQ